MFEKIWSMAINDLCLNAEVVTYEFIISMLKLVLDFKAWLTAEHEVKYSKCEHPILPYAYENFCISEPWWM